MVQGYYTLQQAADILGITLDELNQMVRQREVRAFADGGSWKFRTQDIDELKRTRELASEADLIFDELEDDDAQSSKKTKDDVDLIFDDLEDDDAPSSKSSGKIPFSASDSSIARGLQQEPSMKDSGESDVRLIFSGGSEGSDSDVRLVPDFGPTEEEAAEDASKPPTDSDIRLALGDETIADQPAASESSEQEEIELSSDSPQSVDNDDEFQLATDSGSMEVLPMDDEGVDLVADEGDKDGGRQASDSTLTPATASVQRTPDPDDITEDSDEFQFEEDDLGTGFNLESEEEVDLGTFDLAQNTPTVKQAAGDDEDSDSDFSLSLEDDDIGLAQDVTPGAGDSGINLGSPDDSGILLRSAADSGVNLTSSDDSDSDSEFDVSLESDDDIFDSDEIPGFKSSDTSPKMNPVAARKDDDVDIDDSDDELSDSDFELAIDEDIEVEDESGSEVVAVDEDDDSSDDFDEPSEEYESEVDIEPVVVAAQEAPWGGLWVTFLSVTTIVLVVVMMMMYEITRNAWSYNQPYPLTATIIDNLYQLGQSAGLMP